MRICIVAPLVFVLVTACQTVKDNEIAESLSSPAGGNVDVGKNQVAIDPQRASQQIAARHAYLMAEVLNEKGAYRPALNQLEYAYQLEQSSFLATKLLALSLLLQDHQTVLPRAAEMVTRHPRTPALRFIYGNLLLELGDPKGAIAEFERVFADPTLAELAYLQTVTAYEVQDNIRLALVTADKMAKKFPLSPSALLKISHLYLGQNQQAKAFKALARAYELQPDQQEIALHHAFALDLSNKSSKALPVYKRILGSTFELEELNGQAEFLIRMVGGNSKYLASLFERLIADSEGEQRIGFHVLRSFCLVTLQQDAYLKEDITVLEDASKRYPVMAFLLGVLYERLGEDARALQYYREIHRDEKYYLFAQHRIINVLQAHGKVEEALILSLALINYQYSDWESYLLAASLYGMMDRYQEAIDLLGKGAANYPQKIKLLFMQGVYQEKAGLLKSAIATMEKITLLDPYYSSAFNFLGYVYAERGENLDEAERLIKTALDLKPGDGYYLDSLGMVYYQRGDYEKALALYLRAVEVVPDEGVVYEHIADVYMGQSKPSEAVPLYKKALEKNLEPKDRQRVQRKLDRLQAKEATQI